MRPRAVILLDGWKRSARGLSHRWRGAVIAFLAFLAVPSAVLGVCVGLRFSENVHVVTPGLVYRSAQLLPEELESVIAEYGIRSIISLAPPEPEQAWYQGEISVSSAHGITRYEIPLSRGVRPTTDQLQHLLSALRKAPKPVLLHSQSGADRAGLAAAIFQYAIASRPASEAGRQLSIRYGHFPSILPETAAMDASFDEFVAATRPSGS
jgi:protein tyrosine/serine phosphatase